MIIRGGVHHLPTRPTIRGIKITMTEWLPSGFTFTHPDFALEARGDTIRIASPMMNMTGVIIPASAIPDLCAALSQRNIVHVPLIGTTRDEQPRTDRGSFRGSHPPIKSSHQSGRPLAKALCETCRAIIVAYGWERRPLEERATDPRPPINFTDWQHEQPTDPAHLAAPAADSVLLEPIMRTTLEE